MQIPLIIRNIKHVLRGYVRERRRAALHKRDLAHINRAAERLNRKGGEVLEYQSGPS
jgi:hypothetical protein